MLREVVDEVEIYYLFEINVFFCFFICMVFFVYILLFEMGV